MDKKSTSRARFILAQFAALRAARELPAPTRPMLVPAARAGVVCSGPGPAACPGQLHAAAYCACEESRAEVDNVLTGVGAAFEKIPGRHIRAVFEGPFPLVGYFDAPYGGKVH